jgi:hypothetical protein
VEDVTISSVTGSGPYTATLSAGTVNAHCAGEPWAQGNERQRRHRNHYLRQNPDGIAACVDLEKLIEASPGSIISDDRYTAFDRLHHTRATQPIKASAFLGVAVAPQFA